MTGPGAPTRMLRGEHVRRVVWLPGTDLLRGTCFCGAERDAEDPVELWEWLLAHPDHGGTPAVPTRPAPRELASI
ncbi:hypothetical protein ACVGVM_11670 [Pseudonocardia bannensis]|nr:hypothetical protein [Pseudonocardia bannensis]